MFHEGDIAAAIIQKRKILIQTLWSLIPKEMEYVGLGVLTVEY